MSARFATFSTPGLATATRDGLLGKADKAKLDGLPGTAAPTVDAHGWTVVYEIGGKRRFRRRYLNQAAPASAEASLVGGIALPVGVATCAAVDRYFSWTALAAGTGGTAPQRFIVVLRADETSTTLDITGYSPSGATMSSLMSNLNFFIELVER